MPEDSDASDGGAAPTVAGNAAADAKGAEEDPDYAPGSVVLEDHSPGVTPATAPVAEQKPIIDNRAPDFPITKYTADTPKAPANAVDAAAAGAGAAAPSKREAGPMQGDSGPQILKRTLQIERSSLFNSNSAALRTHYVPQLTRW
ncbi:MAG: hypothetical protein U1F52_09325 [Burkholderiales bacterium]